MTSPKAIIFDFDGTIADSFNIFVETLSEVLGREPLTNDEINALRGSSIKDIEKYFNIKSWQKARILLNGRSEIAKKMNRVKIFDGMKDVLETLHNSGRKIYILSSNDTNSIQSFLTHNALDGYVTKIYGGISITGKSGHLKKLLRQEGLKSSDAIYVGDEVRDIEATAKVSIKCISVSWGYSTRASLEIHTSSAIVSTPTEIVESLQS